MKKSVLLFAILLAGLFQSKAQLVDVIVEEYGTSTGNYPAGYMTYRVYARLNDALDQVSMVYGVGWSDSGPQHPLTIGTLPNSSCETTIWNSPSGSISGDALNSALCGVFPEVCYDSFITIGRASSSDPGSEVIYPTISEFGLSFGSNTFSPSFSREETLWMSLPGDLNSMGTGADNRVLLMQITCPIGELAYAICLVILNDGNQSDQLPYCNTLVGPPGIMGSNLEIDYTNMGLVHYPDNPNQCPGCNDPAACNYMANDTNSLNCIYSENCSEITGCTDPLACNYSIEYLLDDFSQCLFPGCTDPGACNYDSGSGCDDGTCSFPGCTDPLALNFNANAGCDNGTCVDSPTCNDPEACNYSENTDFVDNEICCYTNCLSILATDEFGDGWNGATLSVLDSEGTIVYSYSMAGGEMSETGLCLVSGCYTIIIDAGSFPSEISWQLIGANAGIIAGGAPFSGEFSVGLDSPCGCTDPTACNFSEFAIFDDGTCLYNDACWGCMDQAAVNYDDVAIWDDGSCQYTISAIVFYDTNGNGEWEMNEPGLEGWSAYVPEVNATLYTDENGYFYLAEFAPGNYTLELSTNNSDWTNTTPMVQIVTVPNPSIAAEFGFVPSGTDALFEVNTYSGLGVLGCINGVDLGIWLENNGAIPLNGTFTLQFDPTLNVSTAGGVEAPDEVGPGYAIWNILNQPVGIGLMYSVHVDGPGFDNINDEFEFTRSLVLNDNGDEYYNNSWNQSLTVACSYDPNDKQANPIGYSEPHFILGTERIEYTIRFQNTGNYPAEDILITDQLDMSVLDISTFELNYGTLPFYTCLHDDGLLEFMFVDVYLPDSVNNEPESHGLVSFSIEPLNGLPPGTVINNTAEIYFDQNPAVTTNTTYHTLFNCESFVGITGNLELCEGEGTILSAEQDYVESYSWSINDEIIGSTSIIGLNNLAATDYSVSVYVENPLCGAITVENLVVHPAPLVNAGDDLELCYMQTAELNASSTIDGDFTWNNGLGSGAQQSFVAETSATYEISVTTEFGCSGADDVDVIVHELPGITISQNGDILTAPDGTSWQWFLGEEPIQGATAQEYEVLQDGSYSVLTTNEFGCSAGSEAVFVVGIKDPSAGEFVIYPNPASDHLIIQAPLGTWVFKLFNCIGQEIDINPISDGNVYSVDVSFLDSGTYQLLIMCSKTSVSTRISIK
jgi:hypothetical protein